jgi:hypothetical protein
VAVILPRKEAIIERQRLLGIETAEELAVRAEIHPTQMSRVLAGKSLPGNRFIAGILHVFGDERFQELFAVVPDAEGDVA